MTFSAMSQTMVRVPLHSLDTWRSAFKLSSDELRIAIGASIQFGRAVEISSPALFRELQLWLSGEAITEQARLRLVRYWLRAAMRCTPFGLFAGVDLIGLDSELLSVETDPQFSKWRARPDMARLFPPAAYIHGQALTEETRLAANPWVSQQGQRLYVLTPGARSEVDESPLENAASIRISALVEWCRRELRSPASLPSACTAMEREFALTGPQAREVFEGILETGLILRSGLALPGEPRFISSLWERKQRALPLQGPESASDGLSEFGACDEGSLERLGSYAAAVGDILPPDAAARFPVQVDMRRKTQGGLPRGVYDAAAKLGRYALHFGSQVDLRLLRDAFQARFEGGTRKVLLVDMLRWFAGVPLPNSWDEAATPILDSSKANKLAGIYWDAVSSGSIEVLLDERAFEELLPAIPSDAVVRPDLEVCYQICADSAAALVDGKWEITHSGFGCSDEAYKSSGRFTDLLNKAEQDRLFEDRWPLESGEGERHAELYSIPRSIRAMNVGMTKNAHGAALAVLPFVPESDTLQMLDPQDVIVGIERGRFVLRESSSGREIILHRSHLLAVFAELPIAKLICLLGMDRRLEPGMFQWPVGSYAPFYPRLRVGNIVLSPARWRLSVEFAGDTELFERWRDRWKVPATLCILEDDRKLSLDVESTLGMDLLRAAFGSRDEILLEEVDTRSASWLESRLDDQQTYNCELVTSVRVSDPRGAPGHTEKGMAQTRVDYPPGSAFSYVRLYCDAGAMESLVARQIAPQLSTLCPDGIWFFVRYADARGKHLRVRCHLDSDPEALISLLITMGRSMVDAGDVEAFDICTYAPEYERYGGALGMRLFEKLFWIDSVQFSKDANWHGSDRERLPLACRRFFEQCTIMFSATFTATWCIERVGRELKVPGEFKKALRADGGEEEPQCMHEELSSLGKELTRDLAPQIISEALLTYLHMHFNRYGLVGIGEDDAKAFLRRLALKWMAKSSTQKN